VCEVPGSNANTVAEHTLALILALSRRIIASREAKRKTRFSFEWWRGFELENKTLGVIGTGQIGRRVIRLALAFGMKVLAYDPYQQAEMAEGVRYVSLNDLLRESHVISLHTPLTADTFHLLDRRAFAQCQQEPIVINTAAVRLSIPKRLLRHWMRELSMEPDSMCSKKRELCEKDADQIVTDQIIAHLHNAACQEEAGKRTHEGTKEIETLFRNQRLLDRPNVVFTPHVAFNSVEAVERMLTRTVGNIRAFLAGKPTNVVTP
jgi:D-lactate dehydrogenase